MAEAHDPRDSNTIGSTTELQQSAAPDVRRRSNWGFAITMIGAVAVIAALAWGLT